MLKKVIFVIFAFLFFCLAGKTQDLHFVGNFNSSKGGTMAVYFNNDNGSLVWKKLSDGSVFKAEFVKYDETNFTGYFRLRYAENYLFVYDTKNKKITVYNETRNVLSSVWTLTNTSSNHSNSNNNYQQQAQQEKQQKFSIIRIKLIVNKIS